MKKRGLLVVDVWIIGDCQVLFKRGYFSPLDGLRQLQKGNQNVTSLQRNWKVETQHLNIRTVASRSEGPIFRLTSEIRPTLASAVHLV
jgi:hypothetical protein